MQHFLSHLTDICLEEFEKENQILSQKENRRRSSKTAQTAVPFAEQFIARKSRKKITFQDEAESQPASILTKITQKTSEKAAPALQPHRSSQLSTNETHPKPTHPRTAAPIVFPLDYSAKLKLIRSLR